MESVAADGLENNCDLFASCMSNIKERRNVNIPSLSYDIPIVDIKLYSNFQCRIIKSLKDSSCLTNPSHMRFEFLLFE